MWSLHQYDDKLFCCSDNGIFIMDGDHMEHLNNPKGVWGIVSVDDRKDVLIAGTYSCLLYTSSGKASRALYSYSLPGTGVMVYSLPLAATSFNV